MFNKHKQRVDELFVVLDAIVSLLHKKGLITRSEIQTEVMERSHKIDDSTTVNLGGVEYNIEKDEE